MEVYEGLARVAGIEIAGSDEAAGRVWIRLRDGARTPEMVRALAAESLPVTVRPDGNIGLPIEPWFGPADLTTVVLCVTKVAHHLELAGS